MVGVDHDPVFTVAQAVHPVVQVVEGDVAKCLEFRPWAPAEPGRPQDARRRDRQPLEADQGPLLGKLVEGEVSNGEEPRCRTCRRWRDSGGRRFEGSRGRVRHRAPRPLRRRRAHLQSGGTAASSPRSSRPGSFRPADTKRRRLAVPSGAVVCPAVPNRPGPSGRRPGRRKRRARGTCSRHRLTILRSCLARDTNAGGRNRYGPASAAGQSPHLAALTPRLLLRLAVASGVPGL